MLNLYQEYASDLDRENAIMLEHAEIEMHRALLAVDTASKVEELKMREAEANLVMECADVDQLADYYAEAASGAAVKKEGLIQKAWQAIVNFLNKVREAIFGKKLEKLPPDTKLQVPAKTVERHKKFAALKQKLQAAFNSKGGKFVAAVAALVLLVGTIFIAKGKGKGNDGVVEVQASQVVKMIEEDNQVLQICQKGASTKAKNPIAQATVEQAKKMLKSEVKDGKKMWNVPDQGWCPENQLNVLAKRNLLRLPGPTDEVNADRDLQTVTSKIGSEMKSEVLMLTDKWYDKKQEIRGRIAEIQARKQHKENSAPWELKAEQKQKVKDYKAVDPMKEMQNAQHGAYQAAVNKKLKEDQRAARQQKENEENHRLMNNIRSMIGYNSSADDELESTDELQAYVEGNEIDDILAGFDDEFSESSEEQNELDIWDTYVESEDESEEDSDSESSYTESFMDLISD